MSTEENSKCESVETASIVTLELIDSIENVQITENPENTTMDVDEEFRHILASSHRIIKLILNTDLTEETIKDYYDIEAKVEKLFHDIISFKNTTFDNIVTCAQVYFSISGINTYCLKEASHMNVDYLIKCLLLLMEKRLNRKAIFLTISAYYYLGVTFNKLEKLDKSKLCFNKALQFYLEYTKEKNKYLLPINVLSIIDIEITDFKFKLDELYLGILQYLITLHITAYPDDDKVLIYTHKRLNKMLELKFDLPDNEYISWAMTSAELSEYFTIRSRFTEARNHLAAASFILKNFYEERYLKADKESPLYVNISDAYESLLAHVSIYWAKYGIQLMFLSKKKLLYGKEYDKIFEESRLKTESSTMYKKQSVKFLTFTTIEKDLEMFFPMITDKHLLNYNDAKTVFVKVLQWLNTAKEHNPPEKNIIKYVEIIQNMSKIYKYLVFFEQDKCKQKKMHKRRIEILENVAAILDPEVNILICRQIWIELATIYSTLLDMEMEEMQRLNTTAVVCGTVSAAELYKLEIDYLVKCSLSNFQLYCISFQDSE